MHMRVYPPNGWFFSCIECNRPTAVELLVFFIRRRHDQSYRVPFCRECFRLRINIGPIVGLEYKVKYKAVIGPHLNTILITN